MSNPPKSNTPKSKPQSHDAPAASPPVPVLRYGPPLGIAAAKEVMAAAESLAEANGWPVSIAIVDSTGHLVMLHKADHALYISVEMCRRKAEAAVNFKRPTKVLQDAVAAGSLRYLSFGVPTFEGGMPLISGDEVVGGIGVSGMQSDQDEAVAQAGIRALV